jgi:hypothetical protein
MSKKSPVRLVPFVTVIVLISTTLACGIADDYFRSPEEVKSSQEARDRERTEMALEDTEEAEYYATQEIVRSTDRAQETMIAGMPEEEVKETLFAEESCIVKEGAGYSWENTDHRIVEGDGVTSCKYKFIVRNTSDADQHLVIYETSSTGSDGTQSEGWRVRHLGAHGTYEADYSYVDYHGRSGEQTWAYATSLLIVRKVPECFWLTPSDDPKIVEIWEAYAISPENPCK